MLPAPRLLCRGQRCLPLLCAPACLTQGCLGPNKSSSHTWAAVVPQRPCRTSLMLHAPCCARRRTHPLTAPPDTQGGAHRTLMTPQTRVNTRTDDTSQHQHTRGQPKPDTGPGTRNTTHTRPAPLDPVDPLPAVPSNPQWPSPLLWCPPPSSILPTTSPHITLCSTTACSAPPHDTHKITARLLPRSGSGAQGIRGSVGCCLSSSRTPRPQLGAAGGHGAWCCLKHPPPAMTSPPTAHTQHRGTGHG